VLPLRFLLFVLALRRLASPAMADTVASLTAEVASLEAALSRSLAIGTSTTMPGGSSHAPHGIAAIESLLRSRKVRLARLQAIEADLPPFGAKVLP
jgi:hypothetical protein